ncbi:MAG TPA: alanine--tRNA ligase [Planctomycetota bacterium]|nr:alanine--tRNA ligase [Planctomycetota bacterium]
MPQFLTTDEIRRRWIAFFVERGHKHVASDSLVPRNDPSVLFTGAGMNQFKDHFMGRAKIDHPQQRAVTVQKCIRTGDIENVGRTPNHHTFFEMLGNFSFGDYFKKDAIAWAWLFTTDPKQGLGLEKDRLSVTIYGGNAALGIGPDEEAEKFWMQNAPELQNKDGSWRIYKYGDKDNFWPANAPSDGPNGPCGPCSEMYYDTKPEQGAPEPVADSKDPQRYVEIGNKVFTQFNRVGVGKLEPLGRQNIDVGDGLERIARVIQGKSTNFEIDLLFPIVGEVARIAGKKYESASDDGRRMRRITDHARAAVFCIADGVAPKNEGRNYVVRRLMRRAILDGRELGITEPFLAKVARVVIKQMSVGYPELHGPREGTILRLIEEEENAFNRTLNAGRQHFNEIIADLNAKDQRKISGAAAFKLWDTFGVPIEITNELAEAQGFTVDIAAFKQELEEAAKRSQQGSTMSKEIFESGPVAEIKKKFAGKPTVFRGYDSLSAPAKVLAIAQNNALKDDAASGEAIVLLDQSPFYGESGGQVGDKGWLEIADKPDMTKHKIAHRVLDTQKAEGLILHRVELHDELKVGALVTAEVDPLHRAPTLKNHSATHLLHNALRGVLGTHVEQRGSLVSPERLRFDFTHFEQIKPEQLAEIEARVNAMVTSDYPVDTQELPIAEARARGAMALFGEKYGDRVRVVQMGPSIELCGGTHCKTTGQIGYCRIVSESSVAAGVRRIEALTGAAAVADARRTDEMLNNLALMLKTKREAVKERFVALQDENAALNRELESLRKKAANLAAGELLNQVVEVKGAKLLAAHVDNADAAGLRTTLDGIRKNLPEGAVVLAGTKDGKVALLVSFSPEIVKRGGHAGNLLKDLAPKVGGKGGGKPDMAQGGGTDAGKLAAALAAVKEGLGGMLK